MRFLLFFFLALATAVAEDFQGSTHRVDYERAPIKYEDETPTDRVSQLQHRLATGETKLLFNEQFGYLPSVLAELKIPLSSQVLVFSKTSLQRGFISPENPRALYFNDDVYVGYIPGAPELEISAADRKLGGVFYQLDNEKRRRPRFVRDQACLQCHGTNRTLGVPGHFLRSIATDRAGELKAETEVTDVDHCTPMAERWGGYYVTGTHGEQTHRGNLVGAEAFARAIREPNYLGNLTSLGRFFDVQKFPQATSDIVALMVLEHQAKMHNYITRLNFEAQIMEATYGHTRYLKSQVNAFLRYLLLVEEEALTATIKGTDDFTKSFQEQGPFDSQGRSLRQLDLQRRLFKYPCSFLIYSPAFDALPTSMREHLLERLYAILSNQDLDPQFARLKVEDRQSILEILRETKLNLPAYWRS